MAILDEERQEKHALPAREAGLHPDPAHRDADRSAELDARAHLIASLGLSTTLAKGARLAPNVPPTPRQRDPRTLSTGEGAPSSKEEVSLMATREREVEVGQESVMLHILGEEIGDGPPDQSWCRDYEEVE